MEHFSAEDDGPHRPDADPLWQESTLFCWRDAKAGVGGFLRLAHEPNVAALNCCFGLFTDDGLRFRRNVTGAPLAAGDRRDGYFGWGDRIGVTFDNGAHIRADFPDCSASLRFDDFHPRFDYHAIAAPFATLTGASNHFEVSGRVTGTVRIGEREITVDALGYRDRSWGRRDWSTSRGTRWWPCVFGPDLTTHLIHLVLPERILKVGYVWRGGTTVPIIDSDVVVALESDGITPRGGTGVLHLQGGETLKLRSDRIDGILLHVRGYSAIETFGTAWLEDGSGAVRQGISNLEVSTNATGGNQPPVITTGSNSSEGLSRR
jgi:hypothetical protein